MIIGACWHAGVTFLVWAAGGGQCAGLGPEDLRAGRSRRRRRPWWPRPGRAARGDLTRLLGVDPAPVVAAAAPEPAADARFKLVGVVSPRSPQAAREGLALIAVDGKPPRAYRVGAVVDGPNVLQAVNARGATLGPARRGGARSP